MKVAIVKLVKAGFKAFKWNKKRKRRKAKAAHEGLLKETKGRRPHERE